MYLQRNGAAKKLVDQAETKKTIRSQNDVTQVKRRPTILVVLPLTDSDHLALIETLYSLAGDRYSFTAATDTITENHFLPFLCISKSSPGYLRKLRMSDILIVLQTNARFTSVPHLTEDSMLRLDVSVLGHETQ
jgi:hypothetical protein